MSHDARPSLPPVRVGSGYDIHRLGADRPLVLGGVRFEGEPGLIGHSDADPALHAVIDAILGAAALGDIGSHFPPGDPRWKGADSRELVRLAGAEVRAAGYAVINLDVTIVAERPRIGPRVNEMRTAIADALGIASRQVSIKGKTNEGLDATGRGEAIAAWAVALLAGPFS
jgi:2-C-methyl-D-erythritol 2,4-cyclodiphosphate synthase